MHFDTAAIPSSKRFETIRSLTTWFDMEPIGEAADFFMRSRAVSLGDVKLASGPMGAACYKRTSSHIEADERDHLTFAHFASGQCSATLAGRYFEVADGEAMIWDSARPCTFLYPGPTDVLTIHLPRYMLQPYFAEGLPCGKIGGGNGLQRVVNQARYVLSHAAEMPEEGAVLLGQAMRSLVVPLMLPLADPDQRAEAGSSSLLERIAEALRWDTDNLVDSASLAHQIGADETMVVQTVARYGGLEALRRRQRLIGAYAQLLDARVVLSISQIARAAGYASDAQFSRDFRSAFLLSPREARARPAGSLPRWAGRVDPVNAFASLASEG